MDPLIITAAITGAETTREMNPKLPITPKEQAAAAAECVEAGASIIHLHVRDESGAPTQSLDRFRESIQEMRKACPKETIIQVSTGGAVGEPMEKRIAPIKELKPEMATLNIASMNFGDDVFINRPADVNELAKHMRDLNVVPEVEIYDAGHIGIAKKMLKAGLLKKPIHYQFVLGVDGGLSGDLRSLTFMINSIDPDDTWALAGIGRWELPCSFIAVACGGHVRVGFEDNVYYYKGELAKSNAQLVARVARVAKEAGRPVATPAQARQMLEIS